MAISYQKEFTFRKASPPGSRSDLEKRRADREPILKSPDGIPRGYYSTTIYPNGEFGIGYIGKQKKLKSDRDFDRGIIGNSQWVDIPREHELEDGTKLLDPFDPVTVPVKLDSGSELSQPLKPYGIKGITSYGKKMVRNGAFLLHAHHRKARNKYLQFSTLTIPPFPEDAEKHICSNWAYLQKRFFEECKREYRRHGLNFEYVCVTEIQPKRWEERGEVGLHLHYVYHAVFLKDKGVYCITDEFVRALWHKLIKNLLTLHYKGIEGTCPHIPVPSYRREKVTKSAEGYLGKYMSKGGKIVDDVYQSKGADYLPKQWWSICTSLKKEIKHQTIKTTDTATLSTIYQAISAKSLDILYVHESILEVPYVDKDNIAHIGLFTLGWGGRMTISLREECKVLLQF